MYTNGPNDGNMTVSASSTNETSARNDGSLTLTVTNYTVTYSVSWTDSSSTSTSRTGLAAGAYTCTVTSSLGFSVTSTFYVAASHALGYIARYRFNNSSLGTDVTGSFALTSTGSPATATDATYGTVLYLNGSSYLTAASAMTLVTGAAARTISFWCKTTDTTKRTLFAYGVFDGTSTGSKSECTVQIPGLSSLNYTVFNGTGSDYFNSAAATSTAWKHVVLCYSGGTAGTVTVYTAGTLTSTSTTNSLFTATTTNYPLSIGYDAAAQPYGGFSLFNGYITDFRVYKNSMNSTAVTTIFTNGPNDFNLTIAGTVTNETSAGSDGAIAITVSNYSESYSVSWSDGSSTSTSRTGLSGGVYTITVTSSYGTSKSSTFYVTSAYPSGYIAYYKFNGASVGTDSKGSYALTSSGTPTTSSDATYGTVLSLDGSSYLYASAVMTAVTGSAPRTISFWSKISSTATQRVAFDYGSNVSSGTAVRVQVPSSSTAAFRIADGGGTVLNSATTPTTASWIMYTITYSGGSAGTTIGYLNGSSNLSSTTVIFSATSTTNALSIGRTFGGDIANYSGLMTDFRIYPYLLTSTAISTLYTNGPNDAAMTVTVSTVGVSTTGGDGSASLTIANATSPYTYLWSTGSTSSSVSSLAYGSYSVTVTSFLGKSVTTAFSIPYELSHYVLRYPFNSSITAESTGTYTLTATGSPSISGGDATYGSVAVFGGSEYLSASSMPSSITKSSSRTISFWFQKSTSLSTGVYLFSYGAGTSTGRMVSQCGASYIYRHYAKGYGTVTGTPALSQWYFATMTFSGSSSTTANFYLNGSLNTTVVFTLFTTTNSSTLYIGRYYANSTASTYFVGRMLDFRIFGSVLDSSSISTLYTNGPNDYNMAITGTASSESSTGSDGSISISVSNATLPLTYSWSNGSTSKDATGLSGGYYTVTVTSAIGTAKTASFTVYTSRSASYIARYKWTSSTTTDTTGTYTLTATGTTSIVSTDATYGSVIRFPGSTSYLTAASTMTSVTGTAPRSFSFWAKFDTKTALEYLMSYGATTAGQNFYMTLPQSSSVLVTVTTASSLSTTTTPNTGTWYFIAVTYSGGSSGTVSIYVNGSLDSSGVLAQNTATTNRLNIGRYYNTAANYFVGYMSDFRVYASPLTSTIISAMNLYGPNDYNMTVTAIVYSEYLLTANGYIDTTVSNGTAPFTYSWSSGQTTADIFVLTSGTYTVTVTSAVGKVVVAAFTVLRTDLLVTATTSNASSYGTSTGSIDQTVSGGTSPYSYVWSTGATTQDISSLAAGTYSVTVHDSGSNIVTAAYSVYEPISISSSVTQISTYGGQDGGISITLSGGTGSYSYTWSNSATSLVQSGLSVGTYTLSVTSGTFTKSQSFVIGEPLQVSYTYTNISSTGATDGTIAFTVLGGTGSYAYAWSDGSVTTSSRTGLGVGTYIMTVTSGTFTSATSVYMYNPMVITYVQTNLIASGGTTGAIDLTVSGGTGTYSYSWDDASGSETQDLSGLSAGTYSVQVTSGPLDQTLSFTIDQTILITYTSTNVSSYGGSNGAIDISITGGIGTYTYAWSDGPVTTQNRTSLSAGSYTVTVTSDVFTGTATISVYEPLSISNSVTHTSTYGGSDGAIDVSVAGGTLTYAYSWSDGSASTQDRSSLSAGTYTVTVTSGTYSGTSTATILNALQITGTTTDPSTYGGSNGSIDVSVVGGNSSYAYTWSDGSVTTQDRSGLAAGSYIVYVTSSTLSAQKTIVLYQPLSITSTASDSTTYGGSDGSIDVTVAGGTGSYAYTWSDGSSTSQDRTALAAGSYIVYVTSGSYSSSKTTIVRQPLHITSSVTNASTYGGSNGAIDVSVSGATGTYAYTWSDGSLTTQDRTSLAAGSYTVYVTSGSYSDSLTSTVYEPLHITGTATNVTAYGASDGSIDVSVSGGQSSKTYAWSSSAVTTQDRTSIPAGSYTVTVTSGSFSDSLSFILYQPLYLTYSVTSVTTYGGSNGAINLTVAGGQASRTYLWSDGATTEDRSSLAGGSYTVSVTSGSFEDSETIIVPQPIHISYSKSNVTGFGGSDGTILVTATGGNLTYAYTWSDGDSTSSSRTSLSLGTYTVYVTSGSYTASVSISITEPAAAFTVSQISPVSFLLTKTDPDSDFYKVLYRRAVDSSYTTFEAGTNSDTILVSGLSPSTAYIVQVYQSSDMITFALEEQRPISTSAESAVSYARTYTTILTTNADGLPMYDLTQLATSSVTNIKAYLNQIATTSDNLRLYATFRDQTAVVEPRFVATGHTIQLTSNTLGLYIPFSTNGESITVVSVSGVSVAISYNGSSVSVSGVQYSAGSEFDLLGLKTLFVSGSVILLFFNEATASYTFKTKATEAALDGGYLIQENMVTRDQTLVAQKQSGETETKTSYYFYDETDGTLECARLSQFVNDQVTKGAATIGVLHTDSSSHKTVEPTLSTDGTRTTISAMGSSGDAATTVFDRDGISFDTADGSIFFGATKDFRIKYEGTPDRLVIQAYDEGTASYVTKYSIVEDI